MALLGSSVPFNYCQKAKQLLTFPLLSVVQVARSLGRAVPLPSQLIFTPAATVTAVQSDSSSQVGSFHYIFIKIYGFLQLNLKYIRREYNFVIQLACSACYG